MQSAESLKVYRSTYSQLVSLESKNNTKKSVIVTSKFVKGLHDAVFSESLSGESSSSLPMTQHEYVIYQVHAKDTTNGTPAGTFSFSTRAVASGDPVATHRQILTDTKAFLQKYNNPIVEKAVDSALTVVKAGSTVNIDHDNAHILQRLRRSACTTTNMYHYPNQEGTACFVSRMHPRCAENCLTDYDAATKIKVSLGFRV
jgi:hypothetical protein